MNFWNLFQGLLFAELYAFQIATTEMMTLSIYHVSWKKYCIYSCFYQGFVKNFMKKLPVFHKKFLL